MSFTESKAQRLAQLVERQKSLTECVLASELGYHVVLSSLNKIADGYKGKSAYDDFQRFVVGDLKTREQGRFEIDGLDLDSSLSVWDCEE